MVILNYYGGFGNQIIQYLAASIFAEKFDLQLDCIVYTDYDKGYKDVVYDAETDKILKPIFGSKNNDGPKFLINDDNFMEYLDKEKVPTNVYIFNGFYQKKEFIKKYEKDILKRYIYYNKPKRDGYVIHLRQGDLLRCNFGDLGYDYYKTCIEQMDKRKGYITTDTPDSILSTRLINDFNLELYHKTDQEDFIFATEFDNVILSQGTWSALIGIFSGAKNVYYNSQPPVWHGDIFLHDRWKDMYKK